jgi:hypothetical protein
LLTPPVYIAESVAAVASALTLGAIIAVVGMLLIGADMTSTEIRRLQEEAERHMLALRAIIDSPPMGNPSRSASSRRD